MPSLKIMREFSRSLVDRNLEKREKVGSARPFSTNFKMYWEFSHGLPELCNGGMSLMRTGEAFVLVPMNVRLPDLSERFASASVCKSIATKVE
jgi:hypothetical protein